MKTVGLITEYNPFHAGHEYHVKEAKKISGALVSVVLMSGNFVQRGEPAIIDKYTRTKMALKCGVDVVFELPFLYAVSSAEGFAKGAILIFKLMNIDSICFGSECGDIEIIKRIAELLTEEPTEFKEFLREELSLGNSFPKARQTALVKYFEKNDEKTFADKVSEVMEGPNNLLAIEYVKAVKKYAPDMEIYTIKRQGQSFNDGKMSDDVIFASANAIRNELTNENMDFAALEKYIPPKALEVLKTGINNSGIIVADDFSELLNYKIRSIIHTDSTQLLEYTDVSEPIANKITKLFDKEHFDGSFSELCGLLKSRDYTYTRISRALLHILLDVNEISFTMQTVYARLLGFNENGRVFLKEARNNSLIPVITKVSDGADMLKNDIFATDIYNQVIKNKYKVSMPDEYRAGLVYEVD